MATKTKRKVRLRSEWRSPGFDPEAIASSEVIQLGIERKGLFADPEPETESNDG